MNALTEWFYPGGYLYDAGNRPYAKQGLWWETLSGWELLFMGNPTDEDQEVQLTFYYPDRAPQEQTLLVAAQNTIFFPVFEEKYRNLTGGTNRPFGIRFRSSKAVIPHITRAEYEPWCDVLPGAMFGVGPYPGPLAWELTWCLADGLVSDNEDHPLVLQEWVHVLNANRETAMIRYTLCFPDGERTVERRLEGERVDVLKIEQLPDIPRDVPFGMIVESDIPIVVQQSRRGMEKGGSLATRSIMGTLATPVVIE